MSGRLLLAKRVSDRIMLSIADAAPYFHDYNRAHSAQTHDAVVSVEPPSTPAVDIEVGGIPFHYFAAAEFQSCKWTMEFTRSGFRRDHSVFQSDVLHNPPFNPFHCKFSSFTGHSVGIRCSEGLLMDVASDLEDPVPLAIWAGHTTLAPAPRCAKMICDLGHEVRAGHGGNILFLEERIRNILRMWMIERRQSTPCRPKPCRFTAKGMALLESTLQARCLDNPTLAELAVVVGMGVDPFRRAFRAAFGQTPSEYIMDLRLGLVREALARDGSTPLHALAPACGFTHAPHLARAFKKRYGWTPRQFMEWTTPPRAGAPGVRSGKGKRVVVDNADKDCMKWRGVACPQCRRKISSCCNCLSTPFPKTPWLPNPGNSCRLPCCGPWFGSLRAVIRLPLSPSCAAAPTFFAPKGCWQTPIGRISARRG